MNKEELKQKEKELKSMLWELGHTKEDAQHIIDFFIDTLENN